MGNRILESYFDKWAVDYQSGVDALPYYLQWSAMEIADRIDLDGPRRIFDSGCGNGRLINSLGSREGLFSGADISKEQLKLAAENSARNGLKAEFIKADLEEGLPFLPDNSIDYVISSVALHHVRDKKRLFQDTYRVLKFGGKLVFFDFYFYFTNEEYEKRVKALGEKNPNLAKRFVDSIQEEYETIPHSLIETHPDEFHMDPFELEKLLAEVGFVNCKIIPSSDKRYI